ncbi:MFS transporter [Burkholderia sp. WAC0059]|uniref:MFS transporter n=1 Tax=Burkholderia sp. WAC0059 TaxID=2066022 RepID=UPI000C7F75A5|nr:MFS transporter [Burkholderia sp. WAC0059]PLZ03667.1 MFS transporter [Burkholderia sp. WAC0059]
MRQPFPAAPVAPGHASPLQAVRRDADPETVARSIVARLDRLPATRYVWTIVFLLSLGGCFEFYDLFMTGYVAPGLIASGLFAKASTSIFAMDSIASFVAATFIGLFIGTMGLGFLADRFGRRRIFVVALLAYTAASIAMAFQQSALGVNLFRLLAGLGLGVEMVTINTYVAELMPKDLRGRAFIITQIVPYCAVPVVALMSWWLVPQHPFGIDGWRCVVLASAIGAAFVWLIRLGIPESPRWLVARGRLDEAQRVTEQIERVVEREYGAALPRPVPNEHRAPTTERRFVDIVRAPYLKRTIMMSVFNAVSVIGFYGFSNWIPSLLASKGFGLVHSLQYSFLMSIALPLGPAVFFYFADRVERKWSLVGSSGAVAVFGLLFAGQTGSAGLIVFGFCMNLSLTVMTYSFQTYQSELYPTEIRARAIGFVYSWSRLAAIFSGFLVAFFLRDFGATGVFYMISGCMVFVMLLIGVMGPATKGRALEDINR